MASAGESQLRQLTIKNMENFSLIMLINQLKTSIFVETSQDWLCHYIIVMIFAKIELIFMFMYIYSIGPCLAIIR